MRMAAGVAEGPVVMVRVGVRSGGARRGGRVAMASMVAGCDGRTGTGAHNGGVGVGVGRQSVMRMRMGMACMVAATVIRRAAGGLAPAMRRHSR